MGKKRYTTRHHTRKTLSVRTQKNSQNFGESAEKKKSKYETDKGMSNSIILVLERANLYELREVENTRFSKTFGGPEKKTPQNTLVSKKKVGQ